YACEYSPLTYAPVRGTAPPPDLSTRFNVVQYVSIVPPTLAAAETFTSEEGRLLAPYFTNTDRTVFALKNLPETVKGALFARYSRSAKSLRRLFLDEFIGGDGSVVAPALAMSDRDETADDVGMARAQKLYSRVLSEYG